MAGPSKQPNYLNYGYTQPGEKSFFEKFSAKSIAFVSLALVFMVLTGALGIFFGLSSTPSKPENHLLSKLIATAHYHRTYE